MSSQEKSSIDHNSVSHPQSTPESSEQSSEFQTENEGEGDKYTTTTAHKNKVSPQHRKNQPSAQELLPNNHRKFSLE